MKRSWNSKLSDAELKALLKGLREDVAAPPDFRVRLLRGLREGGLLAEASPPGRQAFGVLRLLRYRLFGGVRWALSAACAAALALVLVPQFQNLARTPPACRPVRVARVDSGSIPGPSHDAAVSTFGGKRDMAVAASPVLAGLTTLPRSKARAVVPHSVESLASVFAPQRGTVKTSDGLTVEAPSQGQGSLNPVRGAGGPSSVFAQGSPLAGAASTSGGFASGESGGVPSPRGGLAVPAKLPTATPSASPTPVPSPTPAVPQGTPAPVLSQNSQVRNNVVLASRGQSAQILFKVAESGQVLVVLYDRMGKKVAVLQNGVLPSGQYNLPWSGAADFGGEAPSGIYEVIIRTPTYRERHKIMLVK